MSRTFLGALIHALALCVPSASALALEPGPAKEKMAEDLVNCTAYYQYMAKANQRADLDAARYLRAAESAAILTQIYLPDANKVAALAKIANREIEKKGGDGGGA